MSSRPHQIESVLILGSGPIVIGQACEFDYSGVQACRALKEEGCRVILVNSNPATIMTDPEFADATYIEPLRWQVIQEIIRKERPQAILPTMGGQTALNCALDLDREGVLEKFNVKLIGANREAIDKAEDRELFRQAMRKIGLDVPQSGCAHNLEEALQIQSTLGYPVVVRPSFTMGGSGGGIAYNREEFIQICEHGLDLSPIHELLIEECLIGWKEYEMEVVRDREDNCIIVCSIENFDPMGIHTGDSITVAPAQTLTDKEYQIMRDASIAVLREIGVDTGGSNVQFGINPENGRMVVIEMNPRVSRSSALASKATGFPIAKVATKLALGYTLNELRNEITGGKTPASFEPTIDYVVTKIPRFNFEKFVQADARLTTQMKSVGEAMAMGRTFQESLQKALRSLEIGVDGLNSNRFDHQEVEITDELIAAIRHAVKIPSWDRIWHIADAFRAGVSLEKVFEWSYVDPWFLVQMKDLIQEEENLKNKKLNELDYATLYRLKQKGFADRRLATLLSISETEMRDYRLTLGVKPVYKRIDSCAAEFPTDTAYLYSTYEEECEAAPTQKEKIIVLGGGPNRIGQGIEFDYCCVHAAMALREDGYETIMVNCNPETVSTDYDISDRLYFEPLTLENVLDIVDLERPKGVIVQYGGQTPLKLARALEAAGVPILGTSPDAIDRAEDRQRFQQFIEKLQLKQPPNATVRSTDEAVQIGKELKYPLVVRPSYVLGGRAMEIVFSEEDLRRYLQEAVQASPESPVLLDHFLDGAIEIDADAICDGTNVFIAGIMEHIEQAGVHSGDSSCSLPPFSLSSDLLDEMRRQVKVMALELGVCGLMNVQFAVQNNEIYILEVNPRASRTVPFVSKATGLSVAKVAVRCMAGKTLTEQKVEKEIIPPFYSVKEPIFPFVKFPGVDTVLGPEMKSTGEVMGVGETFAEAFAKGQLAANNHVTKVGNVFISVRDADKPKIIDIAKDLIENGFKIVATKGTAKVLQSAGIPCQQVHKVLEGRPDIVDLIKNDEITFIINSTEGKQAMTDSYIIRRSALQHKISYKTTVEGGRAAVWAMKYQGAEIRINCLQDLHLRIKA